MLFLAPHKLVGFSGGNQKHFVFFLRIGFFVMFTRQINQNRLFKSHFVIVLGVWFKKPIERQCVLEPGGSRC